MRLLSEVEREVKTSVRDYVELRGRFAENDVGLIGVVSGALSLEIAKLLVRIELLEARCAREGK